MDFSKFSRQQLIDFLRSKSVKTLMKTLSRTVTKFEAPFDGDYDLPKIDEFEKYSSQRGIDGFGSTGI